MKLRYLPLIPIIYNIKDSIVDNVFKNKIKPVEGSIVYCDLFLGYVDHSGIYVGNDRIAHKNRVGTIELVTPDEFIENTTAVSIYISSFQGFASGSENAARRARAKVGINDKYSFYHYNCHQFCSYCLSGDIYNQDILLIQLKLLSGISINIDDWLVWDR